MGPEHLTPAHPMGESPGRRPRAEMPMKGGLDSLVDTEPSARRVGEHVGAHLVGVHAGFDQRIKGGIDHRR